MNKLHTARNAARQVWSLATPYFSSEEKWKARGLLVAIVLLNLGTVYISVLLNEWNRVFYNALEQRNQGIFWEQLLRFTYLAFGFIIVAVYRFYLTQLLELRWRAWMTRRYLSRWLRDGAFYRLELARYAKEGQPTDNPDQRIQEDVQQFTTYTISLSMGLLNAVVTLASFVGILWGLSGGWTFSLGGSTYELHGFMVWAAIAYCIVGTAFTHLIGRPLIPLNFRQQRLEADFRHHMVRVREYSEAIALDRGERVEGKHLELRFVEVLSNYLKMVKTQKNLAWFTNFFGQAANVFPFIVAAPRFFSGAIQLGELMQISSAFGTVQDSLAWFIENYSSLAAWKATSDRLTTFDESLQAQSQLEGAQVTQGTDSLAAHGLDLALPNGAVLASGLDLAVKAGDRVLLKGPSGSGKSTLFRAFGGIWPFARGRVDMPASAMAIPQNPYFPDGPLRAALAYPDDATAYSDDGMKQALADAGLPQLAARLGDEDAWTQKLSGGERQRLALARVFLKQPAWVLADEATSALDAPAEAKLYERLVAMVKRKGGALVSIAHRPALEPLHTRTWEMLPNDEGGAAAWKLRQA